MKMSQLREKFKEVFGVEVAHTFFSPDRINLIGEHTDYNGGHVFPAAITLGAYGAARKRDAKVLSFFSGNLNLVLRDNQTSEEHPDGIYHQHKDVQHIKKENIGLIEVMGLAILPPRLKTELKDVEDYLLGQGNQVVPIHQEWADKLKVENPNVTTDDAKKVVRQSVADIFARVLEDTGVYKSDNEGLNNFKAFVNFVNLAD